MLRSPSLVCPQRQARATLLPNPIPRPRVRTSPLQRGGTPNVPRCCTPTAQPVENPPTLNIAKAGQSVALKWQVRDGTGAVLSDFAIVAGIQYAPVSCAGGGSGGNPVDADDSGRSGLHYDSVDQQFVWTWKTEKSLADRCADFRLQLSDGTVHTAHFAFE